MNERRVVNFVLYVHLVMYLSYFIFSCKRVEQNLMEFTRVIPGMIPTKGCRLKKKLGENMTAITLDKVRGNYPCQVKKMSLLFRTDQEKCHSGASCCLSHLLFLFGKIL